MKEIKVTVSYERPTTNKFDALMAEYEAAKKVADETVTYYKPLADAAEEAKLMAILEQIEPIKMYARQLAALSRNKESVVRAIVYGNYSNKSFSVHCDPQGQCRVMWPDRGWLFDQQLLKNRPDLLTVNDYNILGNWDEWKVYQELENNALRQLSSKIEEQKQIGQKQIDRLNNIIKEA